MESVFATCEGRSRWTQQWFLLCMAGTVAEALVMWGLQNEKLSSPTRIVLGFLPTLLWVACVIALVRRIRRLDEMGKRLQLQAASIAFVATVILFFVFVGLQTTKIYILNAGEVGITGIGVWAFTTVLLARRYR